MFFSRDVILFISESAFASVVRSPHINFLVGGVGLLLGGV